jgi:hypothetical protein
VIPEHPTPPGATIFHAAIIGTLLAMLMCIPEPAEAGTTGAAHGFVRDLMTGQAISGAAVTMCGPSDEVTAKTAPNGFFSIVSMMPGPHRMWVIRDGYLSSVSDRVVVLTDQALTVNVVMARSGMMVDPIPLAPSLLNGDVSDSVWTFNASGEPSFMRSQRSVVERNDLNGCGSRP